MTIKTFREKFNIPTNLASKICSRDKIKVLVKTFHVYDSSNKEDPELILMELFLKKNPECEKIYFQQSGSCSNWVYDIFRLETDAEYENRINNTIEKLQKREKSEFGKKVGQKVEKIKKKMKKLDFNLEDWSPKSFSLEDIIKNEK